MMTTAQQEHDPVDLNKVVDLILSGATLAQLKGWDEPQLEACYRVGYGLYQQQKYDEALKIFSFLCLHAPNQAHYHYAVGACFQQRQDFKSALRHFSAASLLNLDDPLPTLMMAECLIAIDMKTEAKEGLAFVLARCEHNEQYQEIYLRAQALLTSLA